MAEAKTDEQPIDMIEVNWRGKAYLLTEGDSSLKRLFDVEVQAKL